MASDKHKSNVFQAALGGSWTFTDIWCNSGGGGQANTYSGPFSNYPGYHDHKQDVWNKSGDHTTSQTIHGLTHRDWKDK